MRLESTNSAPLIIRADADSRIGTGHVMRCIALGQVWQDGGGEVVFITFSDTPALLQRLRDENFQVIELKDPSAFQPEGGWVVLDGYQFTLEDQRAIRKAGCKLLVIDDYNHLPEYECDILLNQNINAAELNYTINPEACLLLGTRYAMLRREFQCLETGSAGHFKNFQTLEKKLPNPGKNILVTLGGADPDNVTEKVIEALQQLNLPELHAKIIVGPANPHIETLKAAAAHSTFDLRLLTDVKDMPELMNWADLAVTAAGSTCWELCCLGVPFITLVLAENQRGLAAELNARGIATCQGEHPSIGEIADAADALAKDADRRRNCSEKGRVLVDGLGAVRVLRIPAADTGLDLFAGRLSLRPLEKEDADLLWHWANDPSVRGNSYSTNPIPREDHMEWFEKKLGSADSLLLILELDGCPAGQVRYDRMESETAEIDFSIDPQFRGLGLGRRIIELSMADAARQLQVSRLRAQVKETNQPSCRVFERAGFQVSDVEKIEGSASIIFERETEETE